VPDPDGEDPRIGLFSTLGFCVVALAVGLFVAGVFLLTSCQPFVVFGPGAYTASCLYPFQPDGALSLYFAVLCTSLALALFMREREVRGLSEVGGPGRYIGILFLAVIETLIYLAVVLTYNLL
jgi:hypothetical protein